MANIEASRRDRTMTRRVISAVTSGKGAIRVIQSRSRTTIRSAESTRHVASNGTTASSPSCCAGCNTSPTLNNSAP